jgi:hypothetical protein
MPRDWVERMRIHRRAKALLGMRQKSDERDSFMSQCIDQIQNEGVVDNDEDAEMICELLWEEGGESDDFGD